MEDTKIIDLYWSRDQRAIGETQQRYGGYCYSIAYRILDSHEDSEECVSDTCLRAWNTIPPQRPTRLAAFLGTITRRLALDRYERRTADKRGGAQTALLLDELAECIPSAERVAEDVLLKDLLNRFLSSLPVSTRRIFVLRYWYAYSLEEIGRMQGMRKDTVATSLYRTREALKTFLQKEGVTV